MRPARRLFRARAQCARRPTRKVATRRSRTAESSSRKAPRPNPCGGRSRARHEGGLGAYLGEVADSPSPRAGTPRREVPDAGRAGPLRSHAHARRAGATGEPKLDVRRAARGRTATNRHPPSGGARAGKRGSLVSVLGSHFVEQKVGGRRLTACVSSIEDPPKACKPSGPFTRASGQRVLGASKRRCCREAPRRLGLPERQRAFGRAASRKTTSVSLHAERSKRAARREASRSRAPKFGLADSTVKLGCSLTSRVRTSSLDAPGLAFPIRRNARDTPRSGRARSHAARGETAGVRCGAPLRASIRLAGAPPLGNQRDEPKDETPVGVSPLRCEQRPGGRAPRAAE